MGAIFIGHRARNLPVFEHADYRLFVPTGGKSKPKNERLAPFYRHEEDKEEIRRKRPHCPEATAKLIFRNTLCLEIFRERKVSNV